MLQIEFFFSLITMLILVSQTQSYFKVTGEAQTIFFKRFQAEIELHWCAQLEANKANLLQANVWVQNTLPKLRYEAEKAYERELLKQTLPAQFKVEAVSNGSCTHNDLPNLQSYLYRQVNPSIPKNWPNWHYGFQKREVNK